MRSLFRRTPAKITLFTLLMLSFYYTYYTYGKFFCISPPKGLLTALVVPEPTPPCKDPLCTEYLLPQIDVGFFNDCAKTQERSHNWQHFSSNHTCRFMNGTNRGPVALASLPGSGNTWVRGLLEQATEICTGSVYCDMPMRVAGMMGEGIRSGTVLVVKTHHRFGQQFTFKNVSQPPFMRRSMGSNHALREPKYYLSIFIVRDPYDALVSDWNRGMSTKERNGSKDSRHTRLVGPEAFGKNKEWNKFVHHGIVRWQDYFTSWLLDNPRPVLLVRYEDIQADTVREVKRMLEFIKFPYKESELVERLATGFDVFHRASHPTFDHYTAEQRKYVRAKVKETVQLLKEWKHLSVAKIEKYL